MPLEPGNSLGPYSVTAQVVQGGMGEVYRARDAKLDRDVALNASPASSAKPKSWKVRSSWSSFVLVCVAAGVASGCGMFGQRPPNVVIVLSDTLRRDHLSHSGYDRLTSPNLDAFAADATLYTNAFAQSPSTKPSVTSLFTSLYPSQHQVISNKDAVPNSYVMLAEILKTHGHATAAFVENTVIGAQFGFSQGFDDWTFDDTRHFRTDQTMDEFDESILSWLSAKRDDPFFLYVHYIDPHSPYDPPRPWRRKFHQESGGRARRVNRYDEEISYVDHRIGRVLDQLDSLGLRDNTLVIFLSDHGEGFREHGLYEHSYSVYAELINIPLVIRYPGGSAPRRIEDFVGHVDLLPTILDVVGVNREDLPLEGRSLVREDSQEPQVGVDAAVVSEHLRANGPQRAIMRGDRKLIHDIETDRLHLYDLKGDPLDAHALAGVEDQLAPNLHRELVQRVAKMRRQRDADQIELDEDTLKALKALGYVR